MYFFKAMARWAIASGLPGLPILFCCYISLAMHIRKNRGGFYPAH